MRYYRNSIRLTKTGLSAAMARPLLNKKSTCNFLVMTPEYPALAERDSIHTRIALEAKIV
jgi:hypothetical protein